MGKTDSAEAKKTAQAQTNIGNKMMDFAQGQWDEAAPQRQQTSQYWSDILKGGQSLQNAVAPQINAASRQFANARSGIKAMPLSGLRDVSMRNLDTSAAGAKTGIYSGGISDALARLATQGNLGTQAGISGMNSSQNAFSGAGGTYTNLAQMGQNNAAGWGQGLGSLIGMI